MCETLCPCPQYYDYNCRNGGSTRQLTAKEKQQQRRSIVWLAAAVGGIVAYVVLTGRIRIGLDYDDEDDSLED